MSDAAIIERHAWLAMARERAMEIARLRGSVTVDDVREACPPPKGSDPRIMGAVFLHRGFARIGMRSSLRRECHGRPIGVFALKH